MSQHKLHTIWNHHRTPSLFTMFGFGKANSSKKEKPAQVVVAPPTPAIPLTLCEDGRDKYWGLENFGSTCYANSVLQALYYTPPFRNAMLSAPCTEEVLEAIFSEPYPQRSFADVNTPPPPPPQLVKKKKGLSSWTLEEEEKEEFRKRSYYPKGEPPLQHAMFPEPPVAKSDVAFRGAEMKASDDTATDAFKKRLLETHLVISPQARERSDAVLFESLRDVYTSLADQKQRTGILSPKSFMDTLRRENEMFRQNIHHDAHEFLNYILNSVHDGYAHLTKKNALRDTTFVHRIFEGTLASEVRCLTCENITSRDESFLDLSLDIEEDTSVSACMRAFSASEFLREKNKFFCEACNGLQEAERRMKIRKLPKVLALHLKRFKYEQEVQRHVKLQHVVRYETTLRLGNTTDDAADPDRLYELYAVVVHLGGASYHGHYIACVRTDHLGWILYDDEHVERIPESVVMRFIGGEDSGTACAYVLFYRTVDEEEDLLERACLTLPATSKHAAPTPPDAEADPTMAVAAVDIPSPPSAAKKALQRTPSMPIVPSHGSGPLRRSASAVLTPISTSSPAAPEGVVSPRNGFARGMPAVQEDHHGPYTQTQITSTPLDEMDEPEWPAAAIALKSPTMPVRPVLAEKKSGLSRFSSFRGKKSFSFGLNKKDLPGGASPEQQPEDMGKLAKRRSSLFGKS
ncbi:hypothetical protein BCR37DRAFT_67200 [Protomyces lactucae-debilis]|uniref:Ubiquitin carboxyl-terminal hydrolase n=1 Tax=Protomyces lactucae-debilis TaxID=2754530 RepID=A0A1Y2F916_PROLT|nr:uncharacterized protein BCR37DRAFT_67200 [Protomyces lactucae-debilis]ORY80389.1 hypothetical protein BCR37DRAFT_67200 [Protomyces lactucae-debilis]